MQLFNTMTEILTSKLILILEHINTLTLPLCQLCSPNPLRMTVLQTFMKSAFLDSAHE